MYSTIQYSTPLASPLTYIQSHLLQLTPHPPRIPTDRLRRARWTQHSPLRLLRSRLPRLLSKTLSRHPAHRVLCHTNLIIQLIDLLKREPLGLVDKEVDESNAEEAASKPNEEDFGLEVCVARTPFDKIRG